MNNVETELTLFLSLLEKCKKESFGLAFENYWVKQNVLYFLIQV